MKDLLCLSSMCYGQAAPSSFLQAIAYNRFPRPVKPVLRSLPGSAMFGRTGSHLCRIRGGGTGTASLPFLLQKQGSVVRQQRVGCFT